MSQLTPTEPAIDRLLRAAVEVFAEMSFREATVREICTRANMNIASVNYYFRSKEALYRQALIFAFQEGDQRYPQEAALDKNLPAEQRLFLFVDNFLRKLLDDNYIGTYSKLITREITEPTRAVDDVIAIMIEPKCHLLADIIRQIAGENTHELSVQRAVLSVWGQCLVFKHSRSIVDRLFPDTIATESAIADSVQHIVQFTLAALKPISANTSTHTSL